MLARASARSTHAELLAACAAERPLPHALAAVDLALWDRAGRRTGFPVAQLIAAGAVGLGGGQRRRCARPTAPGAAAAAAAAAEAGFRCVKMKVGIGDDAGRVAAVRAAVGDEMAIRVDANGAWDVGRRGAGQPARAGARGDRAVRGADPRARGDAAVRAKSPVPLAMDETAAERGAPGSGAADAVCLKIGRCGGISGLLRDARAARAAGTKVYVASNFDGPLGIAAGVHAAAGLRASGPVAYCGLATLGAFEEYRRRPRGRSTASSPCPPGPGLLG